MGSPWPRAGLGLDSWAHDSTEKVLQSFRSISQGVGIIERLLASQTKYKAIV